VEVSEATVKSEAKSVAKSVAIKEQIKEDLDKINRYYICHKEVEEENHYQIFQYLQN
jgi:hypothetical protein